MKNILLCLVVALYGCAPADATTTTKGLRVGHGVQFASNGPAGTPCEATTPCLYFDSAQFTVAYVPSAGVSTPVLFGAYGASNVSAATSLTLTPARANLFRVALSATAITTMTIATSGVYGGRVVTVKVTQDGTGSRAIPTTWTNVTFAGGTYTATATANKYDTITLIYDDQTTKWVEIGRAMNQ